VLVLGTVVPQQLSGLAQPHGVTMVPTAPAAGHEAEVVAVLLSSLQDEEGRRTI